MSDNNHTAEPMQETPKKQTLEDIFLRSEAQSILEKPFERLITQDEIKAVFDANPQIRERIKELTGYDIFNAPADCLQYWRSRREEFADFFLIAKPLQTDRHPMMAVQLKMIDGKLAAPLELENITFSEDLNIGMNWYTREYPQGFWNWLKIAVVDAKRIADDARRVQEAQAERARQQEAERIKIVKHLEKYRSRFHYEINKLVEHQRKVQGSELRVLHTSETTTVDGLDYRVLIGLLMAIRRDVAYHAMGDYSAALELATLIRTVVDMCTYVIGGKTTIELSWQFGRGILELEITNENKDIPFDQALARRVVFRNFPRRTDKQLFD